MQSLWLYQSGALTEVISHDDPKKLMFLAGAFMAVIDLGSQLLEAKIEAKFIVGSKESGTFVHYEQGYPHLDAYDPRT